ncbi:hypothetical protein AB0A77_19690 [Streptomyces varsoviensis]|uniref:hypothetical protein n=1 Tax=Streptomyces varsoviensis TaxID=67373 RepID=UPI0033F7AF40
MPATRQGFESLTDEQLAQGALQLRTLGLDLHIDGERDPWCGLSPFGPVLDGELLGTQPVEAVRAGAAAGDPGWPSCAPERHVAQRLHTERYGPEEDRGGPELTVWDGHR